MKKLIIPLGAALLLVTSCKSSKAIFNTAVQQSPAIEVSETTIQIPQEGRKSFTYYSKGKTERMPVDFEVTKTIADLQVSSTKIEHTCSFNSLDDDAGRDAAKSYAVNQALKLYGNADVLIEPKYEIKAEDGHIVSVYVSGYPATYCNFRTANEKELNMLKSAKSAPQPAAAKPSTPESAK